jgi:hypothetical protein
MIKKEKNNWNITKTILISNCSTIPTMVYQLIIYLIALPLPDNMINEIGGTAMPEVIKNYSEKPAKKDYG